MTGTDLILSAAAGDAVVGPTMPLQQSVLSF